MLLAILGIDDATARFLGIILSIVGTAVVNRILNDVKIRELEQRLIDLVIAQLKALGLPDEQVQEVKEQMQQAATNKTPDT